MKSKFTSVIIVTVITAVISVVVTRLFSSPKPDYLGEALEYPEDIQFVGDWWYWVERPAKGQHRLVRCRPKEREVIVQADQISGYDATADNVVISMKNGTNWIVDSGPAKGNRTPVWFGPLAAGSPKMSGDIVAWCVSQPGLLADESPSPTLVGMTDVMVRRQGAIKTVGRLLEARADVIDVNASTITVSAERHPRFETRSIYRLDQSTGRALRLAAERGLTSPKVLPSGEMAYAARSQDSSTPLITSCVRKVDSSGKITTIADWLPPRGSLFVVGNSVGYIDREVHSGVWYASANDRLVAPKAAEQEFSVVAIANGQALLRKDGAKGRNQLSVQRRWK